MGVVLGPESEYSKELAKWEGVHRPWTNPDEPLAKPYRFTPYPRMVYLGRTRSDGRIMVLDDRDTVQYPDADAWNRSCQRIVHSDEEYERAKRDGWSDDPVTAYQKAAACEKAIADAAAEAQWSASRMSAQAQAELKTANDETGAHVTDVTSRTIADSRDKNRKAKGDA